jgi:hypothetical protein
MTERSRRNASLKNSVIPAQAGIQVVHWIQFQGNQSYELDSRLRGNDDGLYLFKLIHSL